MLIVQTQWSLASGPSLQSHTLTRHAAPRAHPLPRPGGKEMRRWDSEGGAQTRMGGFSNAPRCPASLTFRDSPALVRQESGGYPVRPVASYSIADRPFPPPRSPLECSGPRQAARRWASAPHAPAPSAPRSHPGPTRTYKTNPASCSQKKRKNGKEETSGGDSPPMQHPREGLPSPKLCLSITPKPAAARGALGAACRTAVARG